MVKVRLEVCRGCTSNQPLVLNAVAHLVSEHGDWLEVVESECLDLCQEPVVALKLDGAAVLVPKEEVSTLEERVRAAVSRRRRRCTNCRARVCLGVCAP